MGRSAPDGMRTARRARSAAGDRPVRCTHSDVSWSPTDTRRTHARAKRRTDWQSTPLRTFLTSRRGVNSTKPVPGNARGSARVSDLVVLHKS
jgi:hypothetical protein